MTSIGKVQTRERKMMAKLRIIGSSLIGLVMAAWAAPGYSQNCALCYSQASSSGSRMIEALRSGILVLIIPPTLMWLVIAAIAYAKRNQFKQPESLPAASAYDW
jgi:hypothetical protein